MEAVCKTNKADDIPQDLLMVTGTMFDSNKRADITPGRRYKIYGIKKIHAPNDTWYFVVRDGDELPWWMSSHLFAPLEESLPRTWVSRRDHYIGWERSSVSGVDEKIEDDIEIIAPRAFQDAYEKGGEESIFDGDPEGYEIFAKMREETGY